MTASMTPRFGSQVMAVTGAASGIGRAVARLAAQEGARVAVLDRAQEGREKVVAEIRAAGGEAVAIGLDVMDAGQVDAAFSEIVTRLGDPDILINCAGVTIGSPAADTSDDVWNRNLRINLDGVFFCCRAALRRFRGGGAIVNIGSITGLHPGVDRAAYAAAKSGVHGLTRSIAVDYARAGVRANCVAPGPVLTPMTQDRFADPELGPKIAATVPIGRFAQPEDIARPALFLASQDAAFITGHILIADGGFTVS